MSPTECVSRVRPAKIEQASFALSARLSMTARSHSPISRLLASSRWLIPLILFVLGFAYVIWENVIFDQYSLVSFPTLLGLFLLAIAGPLLTGLTLHWAYRAALLSAQVEEKRELENQHLATLNKIG